MERNIYYSKLHLKNFIKSNSLPMWDGLHLNRLSHQLFSLNKEHHACFFQIPLSKNTAPALKSIIKCQRAYCRRRQRAWRCLPGLESTPRPFFRRKLKIFWLIKSPFDEAKCYLHIHTSVLFEVSPRSLGALKATCRLRDLDGHMLKCS